MFIKITNRKRTFKKREKKNELSTEGVDFFLKKILDLLRCSVSVPYHLKKKQKKKT